MNKKLAIVFSMLLVMLLPAVSAADTIVTVTVNDIMNGATPCKCYQQLHDQGGGIPTTPIKATWTVSPENPLAKLSKEVTKIAVGDTVTFVTSSTGAHALNLKFAISIYPNTAVKKCFSDVACTTGPNPTGITSTLYEFTWSVIV